MTINLTELRDEPLGKAPHPVNGWTVCLQCVAPPPLGIKVQELVAADDESSFTFDVDGLSDEALDPRPALQAFAGCLFCFRS